jgi:ketosteroid isomerase-like protein
MKKLFSLVLVMLFSAALMQAQDTAELKSKLQTMCDEFSQKMVAGDMSGMWDYYADDAISLPSYEPMVKGVDAIKANYEKMQQSGMKMTKFKLNVTDVMQSGDFVVEIGTYDLTMEGGGMEMAWDDHGKYMNVWEMKDGSMKLKAETWNTDVNPWMEMEKMEGHGEGMGMEEGK